MSNLGLYDAYRTIHPDKQTHPGYTFPARNNTENNHTRIDSIMTSKNIMGQHPNLKIIPKYLVGSDHNALSMSFSNRGCREAIRNRRIANRSTSGSREDLLSGGVHYIQQKEELGHWGWWSVLQIFLLPIFASFLQTLVNRKKKIPKLPKDTISYTQDTISYHQDSLS